MMLWPTDRRLAKSPQALKSLLVVSGLFLCLNGAARADEAATAAFAQGQTAFDQSNFEPALAEFDKAAAANPTEPLYLLWAGRAAGRLAEQVGLMASFRLARRAHDYFERAYQLDPRDPDILADLAEFHEKAPGFVGGDEDRARELRAALKALTPPAAAAAADTH